MNTPSARKIESLLKLRKKQAEEYYKPIGEIPLNVLSCFADCREHLDRGEVREALEDLDLVDTMWVRRGYVT